MRFNDSRKIIFNLFVCGPRIRRLRDLDGGPVAHCALGVLDHVIAGEEALADEDGGRDESQEDEEKGEEADQGVHLVLVALRCTT